MPPMIRRMPRIATPSTSLLANCLDCAMYQVAFAYINPLKYASIEAKTKQRNPPPKRITNPLTLAKLSLTQSSYCLSIRSLATLEIAIASQLTNFDTEKFVRWTDEDFTEPTGGPSVFSMIFCMLR